jgi:hypothetical protein
LQTLPQIGQGFDAHALAIVQRVPPDPCGPRRRRLRTDIPGYPVFDNHFFF